MARRAVSLQYGEQDPRYGIPGGTDEGDDFKVNYRHQLTTNQTHWYPAAAETYRAFTELGEVWASIGKSSRRADISKHGAELIKLAPLLYHDLHASLNKTANTTQSPGHTCYPHRADGVGTYTGCNFRSYPEMFYSAALTAEQTDAMYTAGLGLTTCEIGRWLTMGSPAGGSTGSGLIFVHIPQGMPFGLLVHDMVDRFLLYFFTQSAHSQTRGTWTSPESQTIDRDRNGWPYASPGQANVPMALKWMLCFEEPETRTLWLAKATPRDWLAAGQASPVRASNLTTRYGRVSFTITAPAAAAAAGLADEQVPFSVHASITLPASFATAATAPAGGIRLRIRTPMEHAGKLSGVTVGGQAWSDFDAAEETVNIAASKITASLISEGLPHIVATFAAAESVPLREARFDPSQRVVPVPPPAEFAAAEAAEHIEPAAVAAAPSCLGKLTLVDSFEINGTSWAACEDLQQPAGVIVLVSSTGEVETFSKSYEPYGSNETDAQYYLGLDKTTIANATSDVLAAKLLEQKALSWAAVESAVPPIRATVSQASPSCTRSILTDLYLCDACSCHEVEGGNAWTGPGWGVGHELQGRAHFRGLAWCCL
jgi:phage tail protein X